MSVSTELRAIWNEILVVESVSETDDFFALRGDSVLATMVAAAIEERLGILIDPVELFEHPIFQDFCVRIDYLLGQYETISPADA